jgi:hypothetical protein
MVRTSSQDGLLFSWPLGEEPLRPPGWADPPDQLRWLLVQRWSLGEAADEAEYSSVIR